MTRKQIDDLIENATLQRDRAQKMVKEHFDELDAQGELKFWMNLYLVKKSEVDFWKKQRADDD